VDTYLAYLNKKAEHNQCDIIHINIVTAFQKLYTEILQ